MYCPNCAKENSGDQKYCRACGLSLQTISQIMVDELSSSTSPEEKNEVDRRSSRSWFQPLLFGLAILLLGLIIITVGKKVLGEQLVADIGSLIAVAGVGLLAFTGVKMMRTDPVSVTRAKQTLEVEPTTKLPDALPPAEPPSVTEYTTRQFEPVYKDRKTNQSDAVKSRS